MDKEFEPKKKFKLNKSFFYKYIYVFVLGFILLLGVSYSLTFFRQNYKISDGSMSNSPVNIKLDNNASTNSININATSMDVLASDKDGLLEFSKAIVVNNDSQVNGDIVVSLSRTSGLAFSDLRYALLIDGTIMEIGDMPLSGKIYESVIMANETQNIEVRIWPKSSYTGVETTFVGSLNLERKIHPLTGSEYVDTTTLSSTNNYVYFNCTNNSDTSTCETWRIVKIEGERLVLTNEANYTSVMSNINNLTNSNKFNTTLVLNDYSLVTSMSTDNKAVYLKKTVEIKDGNGTSTSPYILYNDDYNPLDEKVIATITYNNGGDTSVTQPIYYGKTNYVSYGVNDSDFIGWTTTQNGTIVDYELGDIVNFNSNTTLYAVIRKTISRQMRMNVDTTTQINFGNKSRDTNGQGVYVLPGTESDAYPIYYYRGAVTNNNVIFGGFCWQIVRTTNTGGIKMIYNGVATGDGKTCENTTGASRQLATTSAFNTNYQSVSDVGYMYNQRYAYNSSGWTTNALFGSTATWVTDHYELTDASVTTPDTTHHYSCNATTSDATCTSLRYVYYVSGTTKYYITLTNEDTIEDALYKMTGTGSTTTKAKNASYVLNRTDSKAKTEIENWFKTNLTNEEDASKTNYQEYLEDTIYCNDRSYKETGSSNTYNQSGWNPNGGSLSTYLYFGTRNRFNNSNWYSTINIPSMECENVTDRFSVSNQEAKLKYPVGLLTADEIILAGAAGNSTTSNTSYYLYTGNFYWSLSPGSFSSSRAGEFTVGSGGGLTDYYVYNTVGLRPVVSLKLGTEFEDGGEGTGTNPYVVKYE